MSLVYDTSNARLNLLHTLFVQQLANQLVPQASRTPYPFRLPQTQNPFGRPVVSGGIPAPQITGFPAPRSAADLQALMQAHGLSHHLGGADGPGVRAPQGGLPSSASYSGPAPLPVTR